MACTCTDVGLDEVFNERFARRDAARYRKHGLPRRAQRLVQMIEGFIDPKGQRSLEGGAGAGALTVELLRRGVSEAEAIDATPIAMEYARTLAAEFGVADRASFKIGDFADPALSMRPADIVILD